MNLQDARQMAGPKAYRVSLWASGLSYATILFMSVIFFVHFAAMREMLDNHLLSPKSPHTGTAKHCDMCHQTPPHLDCVSRMEGKKSCFDCHATHEKKVYAAVFPSILTLCTRCHAPDIYLVYEKNGEPREIDLAHAHPPGLRPSAATYPLSLPLSPEGYINCVTCHDPHAKCDESYKILRIFDPKAEIPVEILCLDCHHTNGIL